MKRYGHEKQSTLLREFGGGCAWRTMRGSHVQPLPVTALGSRRAAGLQSPRRDTWRHPYALSTPPQCTAAPHRHGACLCLRVSADEETVTRRLCKAWLVLRKTRNVTPCLILVLTRDAEWRVTGGQGGSAEAGWVAHGSR